MVDRNELSRDVLPSVVPPNAIEALKQLRNSYRAISGSGTLIGADQAVLAAVKITLKHLARTS
jgi:hypothetical protein